MNINISKATYSPEDNKLRLYIDGDRVGDDAYEKLSEHKFNWAPLQKLFWAAWSPGREDLLCDLAGEIVAEETTLLERAEAKADRLEALASKRERESEAFVLASNRIAERMNMGQPILVGHHSERKARKDVEKAKRLIEKANEKASSVSYWLYRAEGVERHANYKNDVGVRQRRIKTLLKDLRDYQRRINHGFICLSLWGKLEAIDDIEKRDLLVSSYVGAQLKTGATSPNGYYSLLSKGGMTTDDVISGALKWAENLTCNEYCSRSIQHLLNRLGYERYMLGETARYTGTVNATVIKGFAREHGTHDPQCKKVEGQWVLSSSVPLPVHLGDGEALSMSDSEWCDLMVSIGYEVPLKKAAKPPILNFKADELKVMMWSETKTLRQIELSKSQYSDIHSDYRGVKPSECGKYRVKICKNPNSAVEGWRAEWVCVFLTDSKVHPSPLETVA
ncbi:hydrolase [Alteromonas sp. KUL42]|uniref:DUF3560 domain-containing protein n=1 Tax=Alteromonas sp. KUL42 TaxID=2480797 RepID=UPI0010FFABDB|nr:DUF3560 domain-containing protein [Alteromonas sp. KUL42]GEA09154.1 hydrolase [Alteromonas sp. KUL42]